MFEPETYNFERLEGVENKMNNIKLSRENRSWMQKDFSKLPGRNVR